MKRTPNKPFFFSPSCKHQSHFISFSSCSFNNYFLRYTHTFQKSNKLISSSIPQSSYNFIQNCNINNSSFQKNRNFSSIEPQIDKDDPKVAYMIKRIFDRHGFTKYMGTRLTAAKKGYTEMRIKYSDKLNQHTEYFHGGVISALADNVCGCASATVIEPNEVILTVEFKLNYISPAEKGELIGRGYVIKAGKNLIISKSEIFVENDGKEKLVAISQNTCMRTPSND